VVKNKILQIFKLSENISATDLKHLEEISTQELITNKSFVTIHHPGHSRIQIQW
jgi:hypothetical protein